MLLAISPLASPFFQGQKEAEAVVAQLQGAVNGELVAGEAALVGHMGPSLDPSLPSLDPYPQTDI
jgi:hypothetical protein